MDLKCPDSGECNNNVWENLALLKSTDQIKFVIASRQDFEWTIRTVLDHRLDQRFVVLLSSVFDQVKPSSLAEWLLDAKLDVRMQLQMHKFIWEPDARGV
jgi:7-carboxy-7-deazaguanine synthase